MGNTTSSTSSGDQLHITLKLHEVHQLPGGLTPHVFGDSPLAGAWDAGKSIPMEREDLSTWSLAFVLPANHEELKFKFVLKPRGVARPTQLEEGPERGLKDGAMEGPPTASFRLGPGKQTGGLDSIPSTPKLGALLEFPVHVEAEKVSPFVLAANYKLMKERQQSRSALAARRGLGSMSLEPTPEDSQMSRGLSDNLRQYEVPAKSSSPHYAANATEDPRNLSRSISAPHTSRTTARGHEHGLSESEFRSRCVSIKDLVVLESESISEPPAVKSVASAAPGIHSGGEQKPLYGAVKSNGGISPTWVGTSMGESPKAQEPTSARSSDDGDEMPDAAGAVAAAAIADRMLGPKERRQLAIILVGLPARGKTFTAAKLTRYLRWLGHDTKHFNVGKYRRLVHGANQSADFFRADNQEAVNARHQVAAAAMDDMLAWMEQGGQVGVFDATNSTRERRNMILRMAEGKCKVIFLETICTDPSIIDRNVREKVRSSPDYVNIADQEAAIRDFKGRIENYERAYEPVNEGSYIKLIDMASGSGGQMQINNISGYLPGRIVFFLVNTHLAPRPILITRHGESQDNVRERIGGDSFLSPNGEAYAKKLAEFVTKRLGSERAASIWTSTLQRTVQTGSFIHGFPRVQWRALDEINAGVCDGMTYAEIKEVMPEEYQARKLDKLRYRYPRGESYLDVIQRLEPVIIEIERQRSPVVVVAHQAVLRALYAYFMDKPLKEVPHIEMPLHTVIELSPGAGGVYEKRYKLMEAKGPDIQ